MTEPKQSENRLRALMVEDSKNDADLTLRYLKSIWRTIDFRRVDTASEMSEALRQSTWDVVISDDSLPKFSGQDALALLHESGLDLPFIVVTGTIGEEKAAEFMKNGAHDFVLKDRLNRLGPAIQREMREAESRRERRGMETERAKLLEELKAAIWSRDEFLSVASHELRTPLTPVKLQCQRLLRSLPQDAPMEAPVTVNKKWLLDCEKQVDRLAYLSEQLLDVSRIRTGSMVLEKSEADLCPLIQEVVARVRGRANAVNSRVIFEGLQSLIAHVDPARISEVVLNLLNNAMKFGGGKPIEITLESSGERAVISVRDHGIGISSEGQKRIFERFERAVSASNYGGLGLSLYISRQIVESHGGSIGVESELHQGAKFVVELPLRNP